MSDLTDFLLARIAEDEATAQGSAAAGPWRYDPMKVNAVSREESVFAGPRGAMGITIASTGPEDDPQSIRDARHIARHDPARVLRECEAHRRIVEEFEDERQRKDIYNRDYPLGLLTTDGDLRARLSANARWAGLEVALRALASVYADHPDYDETWRA